MFYRQGYSGYYRDPRTHPDPYSQEWARLYGYPENIPSNPYHPVSGKRRPRVHHVPPGSDIMSPLYIRTAGAQPQKVIPRKPSGYEFYPSEYYSQYSSAFYTAPPPPQPDYHPRYYNPHLKPG